ncbi:MAG: hypothetical protein CVV44_15635 [Spirochaetae bacterium HGW-Spirochaetae-1]|nr:MAG: hypothetical protein CVV44_15635 [Spirochaetae bacterium HGW-Spirochaetae-1]
MRRIMKRNICFILIAFLVSVIPLYAQEKDSGNSLKSNSPVDKKGVGKASDVSVKELMRVGKIKYMNSCFREAGDCFRDVVAREPENGEAWHFLGGVMHHLGQYDAAIEYYTKAIKLDPAAYHSFHNRGLSRHYGAQYDSAIQDYSQAIELNRDYFKSWYFRGLAYLEKGEYARAVEDFNVALLMQPHNHKAWYLKGYARYKMGDAQAASGDYMQALRLANQALPEYSSENNPYLINRKGGGSTSDEREKARAKSF